MQLSGLCFPQAELLRELILSARMIRYLLKTQRHVNTSVHKVALVIPKSITHRSPVLNLWI